MTRIDIVAEILLRALARARAAGDLPDDLVAEMSVGGEVVVRAKGVARPTKRTKKGRVAA